MSEKNKEKKERDWADRLSEDTDRDDGEAPEKTYRDGSAVHECWASDREGV